MDDSGVNCDEVGGANAKLSPNDPKISPKDNDDEKKTIPIDFNKKIDTKLII